MSPWRAVATCVVYIAAYSALVLTEPAAAQATGPVAGPNSTIEWQQADTLASGFKIRLCTTGAGCTASTAPVAIPTSTLTGTISVKVGVLGPMPNGQKYICVQASNAAGDSACSAEFPFVFVGAPPASPSGLTVKP